MCNPQTLNCGHTFCRWGAKCRQPCHGHKRPSTYQTHLDILMFYLGHGSPQQLLLPTVRCHLLGLLVQGAACHNRPASSQAGGFGSHVAGCCASCKDNRVCLLCCCCFHRECVVDTLEGPGIVKSQCPICKQPAWKKELKTNHKYLALADATAQLASLLQQQGDPTHTNDMWRVSRLAAKLAALGTTFAAASSTR